MNLGRNGSLLKSMVQRQIIIIDVPSCCNGFAIKSKIDNKGKFIITKYIAYPILIILMQ